MTAALVATLGDYFALPYPFAKLDVVAVPDFAAGAMENPGLITFREELLLLDPVRASVWDTRDAASTIAHELAHIWFGDLVTMQWWNDVWLNEGFADWMEAKAVDAWRPESAEHLDNVASALDVMDTDALANAHAVRQAVTSTGEIEEAFDGISYQKGAAVLGMIEHWVGPEVFQRGIRDYLHAHSWKNATADDLLKSLDHASGRDVSGMAATFIDRPGVPNVAVTSTCAAGTVKLDLTQSAWHPLGVAAKPTDDVPWRIPVCVHALSAPAGRVHGSGDGARSLELEGARSAARRPFPNAEEAGYYRTSLSDADVRALARDLTHLDVASRMGLVASLWAQVRAGELSPDVVLEVLPSFDKETDGHVVGAVIDTLYAIDHALIDDRSRPAFRAYVAARLLPQKSRLGWQVKPGEDDDVSLLRPSVLMALGSLAREASTIREAEGVAASWLKDPEERRRQRRRGRAPSRLDPRRPGARWTSCAPRRRARRRRSIGSTRSQR